MREMRDRVEAGAEYHLPEAPEVDVQGSLQGVCIESYQRLEDQAFKENKRIMPITATESTFEPVAEGIHEAMLAGWEEAEDRGFGPGVKLIWNLVNEPDKANGDPADMWQFMSQKLTPKSTFWGVLKGLGNPATLGETYELADLLDPCVGVVANLVVKHEDGPNGPRAKVKDVLPIKGKK